MLADDNKVSFLPLFCIRAYIGAASPAPVTSSPPTALHQRRPANRYTRLATEPISQRSDEMDGMGRTRRKTAGPKRREGRLYGTSELVAEAFTTG
jgi:hypothetical protein